MQWALAMSTPGSQTEDKSSQESRLRIWRPAAHTLLHPNCVILAKSFPLPGLSVLIFKMRGRGDGPQGVILQVSYHPLGFLTSPPSKGTLPGQAGSPGESKMRRWSPELEESFL